MTVLTAALPVMEAVFGVMQDADFQERIGGRFYDSIPEDTPRPCGLYEIVGEEDKRGFGFGNLPELDLRTHMFSDIASVSEALDLNRMAVALLKDALLTVTGYRQCGHVTYRQTVLLRDQELDGQKVHEVVSLFTVWMEQT